MKIAHVIGIFSPEHGGPVVSCRNYAEGQAAVGHDVSLFTLEGYPGTSPALRLASSVAQHVFGLDFPAKLGRSRSLRRALLDEGAADIYHLHGIWLRAIYYGQLKARKESRPYVVEINGALDPLELATKPWRKRLVRRWYQDRLLQKADCLHVNSAREARHVRELGFINPIAILPAGFNAPEADSLLRKAKLAPPLWREKLESSKIILYLARIHEAKGIDLLLHAWRRLTSSFPDWKLVIVGPGTAEEVARWKEECHKLALDRRCEWLGLISDRERAWIYDRADVYVLPSRKENFGNTIQEALGYGIPVVTTFETPWLEIEQWGCGWLCRPEIGDLADAMRKAMSTSNEDRKLMGNQGREIIIKDYSLDSVVARQLALYAWLCGGEIPAFVSFN